MTSTLSRTRSAASPGSRSRSSSADRNSKQNILAFDVAKLAKPFAKLVAKRLRVGIADEERTHAAYFRLLREGAQRPDGRAADMTDECSPLHDHRVAEENIRRGP